MKLQKYLTEKYRNETKDIDKIYDKLKKDCAPYISMLKSNNIKPFIKGIMKNQSGLIKKDTQAYRSPRGMMPWVADEFNRWLEKNKHNTRNGSVIATSNRKVAEDFGILYWVFPIGELKYTWVDTKDINVTDPRTGWYNFAVEDYLNFTGPEDHRVQKMKKPFPDYFHTNKDIKKAYNYWNEIWFSCDKYYILMINDDVEDIMSRL
jgi:hypothetical protein